MNTLARDLFYAYRNARNQSTSWLHQGKPSGIRYQGEAEGLLIAIRLINEHKRREWEEQRAQKAEAS